MCIFSCFFNRLFYHGLSFCIILQFVVILIKDETWKYESRRINKLILFNNKIIKLKSNKIIRTQERPCWLNLYAAINNSLLYIYTFIKDAFIKK